MSPSHPRQDLFFTSEQNNKLLSLSLAPLTPLLSLISKTSPKLEMSTKEFNSARRGSSTSSISVTVTTTTQSSLPSEDIEDHLSPLPCFVESTPSTSSPQSPSPVPTPPALVLSLDPPPPPYQFPPSPSPSTATLVNPLSFYPFQTLTPVSTSFPSTSPPSPPPPPSYAEVPQTLAERYFIYGFLFFPLWILGALKYWISERPTGFSGEKLGDLESGMEEEERRRVEESLESWRQEELVWSLRCLWSLASLGGVGLVLGVLIAGMMGKL